MLVWRKLASAKWEDAWVERLRFVGPERLAITSVTGSRMVRLEAYAITEKEGRHLVREFGGTVRTGSAKMARVAARDEAPVKIRSRLILVKNEPSRDKLQQQFPLRKVIVVPAAMAFGTGEHATTAQCLRFLCDAAADRRTEPWDMLDLGTGTGVLAIAARALGASRAEAFDFDPQAVRTARENVRLNRANGIAVRRVDVTDWIPSRSFAVVTANLFSEVLIRAAPAIVASVAANGMLLVSGILRSQESDSLREFQRHLRLGTVARRGKWVTALFHH